MAMYGSVLGRGSDLCDKPVYRRSMAEGPVVAMSKRPRGDSEVEGRLRGSCIFAPHDEVA